MIMSQPLSQKTVIKLLVIALIVVSLYAGYYHATVVQLRKNYANLETMYDTLSKEKADIKPETTEHEW